MFRSTPGVRSMARLAAIATGALCAILVALPLSASADNPASTWAMGGQNIANTRYQPVENQLSPQNIHALKESWTFTTHGDVSATAAALPNGDVYFPDMGGYLYAVNGQSGNLVWENQIATYEEQAGFVTPTYAAAAAAAGSPLHSRTSPAYDPTTDTLYVGDQGTAYFDPQDGTVHAPPAGTGTGDHLFAIDASTGQLRWAIQLESNIAAIDTQSPSLYNGVLYVGNSSLEESYAAESSSYQCCTFRGSLDAIDLATHSVKWQTYMLSDADLAAGYSGDSVWGSIPAIDPEHNVVYIGTGNNYTAPAACTNGTDSDCDPSTNHFDSIVALNLDTGAIEWYGGTIAMDAWNVSCIASEGIPGFTYRANCPPNAGPDYDFGSGPMILTTTVNGTQQEVVVAGAKSGEVWEFPTGATGGNEVAPLWGNALGPGAALGGVEWGSASDGTRIYVAEANDNQQPVTMQAGSYAGQTICTGFWAALNPANGAVEWETPVQPVTLATNGTCSYNYENLSVALGPVSVANGVVYAGALTGAMNALDASTGQVLWTYQGAGSSNGGATVVDGDVYWGNGYTIGLPSTTFYAFKK